MISEHSADVARRAKAIYAQELQSQLEAEHPNCYVAIEPDSKTHFIADSFSSAVQAARKSHPEQISFVIHIGHEAAVHLGGIANEG